LPPSQRSPADPGAVSADEKTGHVETRIIEAQQGPAGLNWGKFMIGRLTSEWNVLSAAGKGRPLLRACGWSRCPEKLLVLDLQTGEGAWFEAGAGAREELKKHRIWVCVLFEPFLEWLFAQDLSDLRKLPRAVDLPDAEPAWSGYRRTRSGARTAKIPPGGSRTP
jgi:hypothetical protein